jgi:hypothetical protein
MGKYDKYIIRDPQLIEEPKFHGERKLRKFVGAEIVPEAQVTIHGHWIERKPQKRESSKRPVVLPHSHDVDQVYLCLGEPGAYEMEVVLGDEKHTAKCPFAVYIPAGLRHWISWEKTSKTPVATAMVLLCRKYTAE